MADTQQNDGAQPPMFIFARSKRQAMDWSLVLASQDIAVIIDRQGPGWVLTVDEPDYVRAMEALRQYQLENRSSRWRGELPGTDMVFHWGSLLWVGGIIAFYWASERYAGMRSMGMVDSGAVLKGQWWRLFTAITLHENLPHLASNAAAGFLLLGLAMARFGPGVALLASFLAGAAGNLACVMIDRIGHYSLGASGMVTAALGLITVQSAAHWRHHRTIAPWLPRAGAAGILILVLIGFSPGVDVLAHVGGFVAGGLFGLALAWIKPARLQETLPNAVCGILLAGLIVVSWLLAGR